ncbi:MAG TPA: hypothetical protein VLL52_12690 [Anaerolineae bacterium]|nr:hypothetical protein [Anaerolineae bacterium]
MKILTRYTTLLITLFFLTACGPAIPPTPPPTITPTASPTTTATNNTSPWPPSVTALPLGDPTQGAELFTGKGACHICHGLPQGLPETASIGPWPGNIAAQAATKIDGYTAADYLYESILNPDAYIVEQCPIGPCPASVMPQTFAQFLTPQETAHIIAYLLNDTTFTSNTTIRFMQEE